jgi:hypothetical protein
MASQPASNTDAPAHGLTEGQVTPQWHADPSSTPTATVVCSTSVPWGLQQPLPACFSGRQLVQLGPCIAGVAPSPPQWWAADCAPSSPCTRPELGALSVNPCHDDPCCRLGQGVPCLVQPGMFLGQHGVSTCPATHNTHLCVRCCS